jgi:hypothetical protein
MNSTMAPYFGTLLGISPVLLVYIIGIVLAAVWWGRWPLTCGLVMAGLMILLVVGLVQPYIQLSMTLNRTGSMSSLGQQIMLLGIVSNVLRAGGIALLLFGAFSGRPTDEIPSAFPVNPTTMPPR